ncbi:sensor domain-containing diguanylate cyclase [Pseudodesulfovibrio senegalensis]|uniref:PAS domain S-box protein n=1 Tax=Pseudodesulfovibrio senegalensis TaxID=1721087 RepID=A0A6N6N665_9BACT|nr:PAS domain S-box protein [Pseudodesulfovibrio senegalensis]KAB1443238.1 PAS domain S-box protein [Pseudodesulfovibrio senegalensis]
MQMPLRRATSLIILFVFGILVFLIYTTSVQTLQPRFQALERQIILRDVHQVKRLVADKIQTITVLTKDWAWWDDTYAFVKNRNKKYIKANLPLSTFTSTGLNLIAFYDTMGQTVWGAYHLREAKELAPVPWIFEDFVFKRIAPWGKDYSGTGFNGLVTVGDMTLLLACEQILTSDKEGPARGWLLMGMVLTPAKIEQWAAANGLDVTAHIVESPEAVATREFPMVLSRDDGVEARSVLRDMNNVPAMLFTTKSSMTISKVGDNLIMINFAVMGAACLLMGGVTLLLLQSKITRRIFMLARQVNAISQTPNEAYDISIPGQDEITDLARDVNSMVHQIKEEKRFLDNMMRSVQVGIFLIAVDTRIIVEANPHACALVGLPCEDIVGKKCHGFICPNKEKSCPVLDLGQPNDLKTRTLLRADGKQLSVLKSVTPITRDGTSYLLESFVDITELETTRAKLEKSEERYRTIFNNTGTASVIVNEDTTVAMANNEFYRLTGYTRKQIENGLRWTECFHPDDVKWMLEYHQQRRVDEDGLPRRYETRFIDASGNIRIVELMVSMFPGTSMSIASLLDITEHKSMEQRLAQKAFYDTRTNLPNHLLFQERLQHALAGTDRRKSIAAVVLISMENGLADTPHLGRKQINIMTQLAAARLREIMRDSDTLARIDSTLLAMVCEDIEVAANARLLAARILEAFEDPVAIDMNTQRPCMRFGMALYPHDSSDPTEIIRKAEMALSKVHPSDTVRFAMYSDTDNQSLLNHLEQESTLSIALETGRLKNWFMPILHTGKKRICGFSCELHPTGNEQQFMPQNRITPSRQSLSHALDLQALRVACRTARKIEKNTGAVDAILYRLSPGSFADTAIVNKACATLHEQGVARGKIILAIPARGLTVAPERALRLCDSMNEYGVRFALTGFGHQSPPIQIIQRAAPSLLLLDTVFTAPANNTTRIRPEFMQALIQMGKALDIPVVATEVNTREQMDRLIRYECEYIQGEMVSKPQDADSLERLFGKRYASRDTR